MGLIMVDGFLNLSVEGWIVVWQKFFEAGASIYVVPDVPVRLGKMQCGHRLNDGRWILNLSIEGRIVVWQNFFEAGASIYLATRIQINHPDMALHP